MPSLAAILVRVPSGEASTSRGFSAGAAAGVRVLVSLGGCECEDAGVLGVDEWADESESESEDDDEGEERAQRRR